MSEFYYLAVNESLPKTEPAPLPERIRAASEAESFPFLPESYRLNREGAGSLLHQAAEDAVFLFSPKDQPEAEAIAALIREASDRLYPELTRVLGPVPPAERSAFLLGKSGKKLFLLLPPSEDGREEAAYMKAAFPPLRYLLNCRKRGEKPRFGRGEGYVYALNRSSKKGTVKTEIPRAVLKENYGMEGDAHAGKWHRQISLLAEESIDSMRQDQDFILPNGIFAENINTAGLDLKSLPVGTLLRAGDCLLEVSQIGKRCHDGCAIKKKVGRCVMPTEGIFAVVKEGGVLEAGDPIRRESP